MGPLVQSLLSKLLRYLDKLCIFVLEPSVLQLVKQLELHTGVLTLVLRRLL